MLEILQPYQERYKRGLRAEDRVAPLRRLFTVGHKIAPPEIQHKMAAAESVYFYVRLLDDLVDEHPYIGPVRQILFQEQKALCEDAPTQLQEEYLVESLSTYPTPMQAVIKRQLRTVITGLAIDLRIRETQIPLSTDQLKRRNILCLWPCIVATTAGWLSLKPILTQRMARLMNVWAEYDNIEDLTPDLQHGLILVSHEDLKKYNLKFENNQKLPYDRLENYYNRRRWGIIKELTANSGAIFEIGLPIWMAFIAYLYFQTRWVNLVKPLYKEDGARFETPKDVAVFTAV